MATIELAVQKYKAQSTSEEQLTTDHTLFDESKAKGAKVLHPPTNYPWAHEMQIEDPDGNVLRIGSGPKADQPVGNGSICTADAGRRCPRAEGGWLNRSESVNFGYDLIVLSVSRAFAPKTSSLIFDFWSGFG